MWAEPTKPCKYWKNWQLLIKKLTCQYLPKDTKLFTPSYNPEFWKHCENITVQQFCDYLQNNIPSGAVMCVCGCSNIYMHLEEDGSVFSVDHDSLSDLAEYEDCEAGELTV